MILIAFLLSAQQPICNPNGSQVELNACAGDEASAADRQLNAVWLRVRARMQADDRWASEHQGERPPQGFFRQALEAQRTWLAFRDQHCMTEGNQFLGGSIRPMIVAGCRARVTRERTRQLETMIRPNN